MKKSYSVCKLIFKLWYRSIRKVLNSRLRLLTALFLLVVIVLIAAFAGYKLTSSTLHDFLNGDERLLFLLTVALHMNSSIFVFGLFIFFKSITPEQNRFSMQLRWFPLKAYERSLGYHTPIIIIISAIVLCCDCIIVLPSLIMAQMGIVFPFLFFVVLLMQIVFVNVLLSTFYNLFYFVLSVFKLPFKKFITLFLVMAGSFYYMFSTISITGLTQTYLTFDYNVSYLGSPLFIKAMALSTYSDANVFIILSVFVLTLVGYFFSLFLSEHVKDSAASRFLQFIPMPKRNKAMALFVKELKTQCRNEENVLNFMIFTMIAVFLRLKFQVQDVGPTLLLFLSGTSGILALNSYGNEGNYSVMYRTFTLKAPAYFVSKFLALLLLSCIHFLFLAKVVLALPLFEWSSLWKYALILLNSALLFYLLGIIVPVGKNNPHMGALALSVFIFVLMPITFIATYALAGISTVMMVFLFVVFEILLCGVLYYVSNWRFNQH